MPTLAAEAVDDVVDVAGGAVAAAPDVGDAFGEEVAVGGFEGGVG